MGSQGHSCAAIGRDGKPGYAFHLKGCNVACLQVGAIPEAYMGMAPAGSVYTNNNNNNNNNTHTHTQVYGLREDYRQTLKFFSNF